MYAEKQHQDRTTHTFKPQQKEANIYFIDNRPSMIDLFQSDLWNSNHPVQMVKDTDFARTSNDANVFYRQLYAEVKRILSSDIHRDVESFPESNHLWWSIKKHFKTEKNIDCIIGKCSSASTGAFIAAKDAEGQINSFEKTFNEVPLNERQNYKDNVLNVINNLVLPIQQTLDDILYWGLQNNPRSKSVNNIELTDNDMHSRGVGVCIVEYCDSIIGGTVTKRVIKPEDKSFEAKIYGKDNSLADNFNTSVLNIDNNIQGEKDRRIGTLDIKASHNRGSSVEFFEHERYERSDNSFTGGAPVNRETLNVDSFINTMIFSSLLGLADLHKENLVFGKDSMGKRIAQFIDAEIGFKYRLSLTSGAGNNASPLRTVSDAGELINPRIAGYNFTGQIINEEDRARITNGEELNSPQFREIIRSKLNAIITFLNTTVKNQLANNRSRIVPLSTGEFYKLRHSIYKGNNLTTVQYITKLREGSVFRSIADGDFQNMDQATIKTRQDCLLGRIPFFEYDFPNGAYLQKFSDGTELILYQNDTLKLDNIITYNVGILNTYFQSLPPVGNV